MAAPLWWECSECGERVQRPRAPAQCRECGTAGAIFVPAEGAPEEDDPRVAWLEAGMTAGSVEAGP